MMVTEQAGFTAQEYCQNKCVLSDNACAKIIKQVLLVLRSLHKAGIVHRDLTPESILID